MLSLPALALLLGSSAGAQLAAAAAQSSRPAVCGEEDSRWSAGKRVQLRVACDALAKGYAALQRAPGKALELAESVQGGLLKDDAALLAARAEVALGRFEQAHRRFVQLAGSGARPRRSASALHDEAVAASHAGAVEHAVGLYRALAAQRSLLSAERQARLLVEAAVAELRRGPAGVEQASVFLDAAEEQDQGRTDRRVLRAVRQLADVFSGTGSEELAMEPQSLLQLLGKPGPATPRLPTAEVTAVLAALLEPSDAPMAAEAWRRYMNDPLSERWRPWLRQRLGKRGVGE